MLKRRILPLLVAVALLVALSSAALASDPTPAEREQRMAYIRWRNTGLQTTDFNFDPAAVLTRGMAAEVFARLLGLRERAALDGYADVGMDTPHAGALAKCVAAGIIGGDALKSVEDEAIRALVAKQKELGFKVVTDGEFRRSTGGRIARHRDFV